MTLLSSGSNNLALVCCCFDSCCSVVVLHVVMLTDVVVSVQIFQDMEIKLIIEASSFLLLREL